MLFKPTKRQLQKILVERLKQRAEEKHLAAIDVQNAAHSALQKAKTANQRRAENKLRRSKAVRNLESAAQEFANAHGLSVSSRVSVSGEEVQFILSIDGKLTAPIPKHTARELSAIDAAEEAYNVASHATSTAQAEYDDLRYNRRHGRYDDHRLSDDEILARYALTPEAAAKIDELLNSLQLELPE